MKKVVSIFWISIVISISSIANSTDSITFYLNNYQPGKALQLIDSEIQQNPEAAIFHYYKAQANKAMFNITKAVNAAQQATLLDSLSINNWFLLAELQHMAGNIEGSIASYNQIISFDSTNLQANFKVADMYFKDEKYMHALGHYNIVANNDSTNWYAFRRIARCYEKLGFPGQLTIPAYYHVLELNPADRFSKHRISFIYVGNKLYREAVDATNEFLQFDSLDTKILSLNGFGYLQLHEQDSAIKSFSKCIELNDTSYFNYKYLGLACYNKRWYHQSVDYFEKAYKINSQDPRTVFYLGASWARSLDSETGVKYLLETIDLLQPDEEFLSKAYSELGHTYSRLHKSDEAEEAFNMAFEYNNSNRDLYFIMGMHYRNKDHVLAEKYLTMYIDSTLADNDNSAKSKHYREFSEKMLEQIEEEKFWNDSTAANQ